MPLMRFLLSMAAILWFDFAHADIHGKTITANGSFQSLLCQGSRCKVTKPTKLSVNMYVSKDATKVFDYASTGARGDIFNVGRQKNGMTMYVKGDTLSSVYRENSYSVSFYYKVTGNSCSFSYRINFRDPNVRDTPHSIKVACKVSDGNINAGIE